MRLPAVLVVIVLAAAALAGCASSISGSPYAGSDELSARAAELGNGADADDLGETPEAGADGGDADSSSPQATPGADSGDEPDRSDDADSGDEPDQSGRSDQSDAAPVPPTNPAETSESGGTATEPDGSDDDAGASAGQAHTGLTLPHGMAADIPFVGGEVVYSWWAPSALDEGTGLVEIAIAVDDPQSAASWVRSALSETPLTEKTWTADADGTVLAGFRSDDISLLLRVLPTDNDTWMVLYQIAVRDGDQISELGVPDEGNTAACDAAYEFTLSVTSLRLAIAMKQGALASSSAQQNMDEMFALVEPYTAALKGELKDSYELYHDAASQAIGKDDVAAMQILGVDEPRQAEQALVLGLPAVCATW